MNGKRRAKLNRFDGIVYNGDWHTRLLVSLELAKEASPSPDTLSAITALEQRLSIADECVHTVTLRLTVPPEISNQCMLDHVEKSVDVEDWTICVVDNGGIELTITERGAYSYVVDRAERILSAGHRSAWEEVRSRKQSIQIKDVSC